MTYTARWSVLAGMSLVGLFVLAMCDEADKQRLAKQHAADEREALRNTKLKERCKALADEVTSPLPAGQAEQWQALARNLGLCQAVLWGRCGGVHSLLLYDLEMAGRSDLAEKIKTAAPFRGPCDIGRAFIEAHGRDAYLDHLKLQNEAIADAVDRATQR